MAGTAKEKVMRGSENVFADIGFENPEQELAKAKLVHAISKVIAARRMTQAKLAKAIGIDQPQVSKLLRGRTAGYSTDRLIRILNQLGQDVEIKVRSKAGSSAKLGSVYVVMAKSPAAALRVSEAPRKKRTG